MVNPGVGIRSWIGLAEETTYGTPVASTNFIDISSESLALSESRIESGALARVGMLNNRFVQGGKSVEGDIVFEALYDGWELFAKHAFGQVTTTQPDVTNAATAYQHLFQIADTLPTGLSIEVFRDTSQFTTEPDKSFQYQGCKVSTITFENTVEDLLRVTCGIMAEDEVRISKGTESFSTEAMAVYHQGVLTWNTSDLCVEEWSITLSNSLAGRPKLNSRLMREPIRDAKLLVTGSFTAEFSSWNEYDDFKNASERALLITYTGANIGGSVNRLIKFDCTIAVLSEVNVILNAPGRILVEHSFKAYRSTSKNELELTMINTTVSV